MAKKKQEEDAGAPAWVMTFADLMSLLMCFFVLLLSFSELDRKKYKQVAGSMKQAFGVQREIPTQESPKGVTIIAQEFAPGKPQPTMEQILQQETTDDTQDYLEVLEAIDRVQEESFGDERGLVKGNVDEETWSEGEGDASKRGGGSDGRNKGDGGGQGQGRDGGKGSNGEQTRMASLGQGADDGQGRGRAGDRGRDGNSGDGRGRDGRHAQGDGRGENGGEGKTDQEFAEEARAMEEALRQALEDAKKQAEALRLALKDELGQALLEVDAGEQGVLIKVREQGSFPSGQASLKNSFLPVLRKIAGALINDSSELVVAGHTDNIPISTGRFPSNWELSAARASSVVQGFIAQGVVAPERMQLRAYADTEPMVPNDTPANRAQNRRVEIFVNTMPDPDARANVMDGTNDADGFQTGTVEPGEEFEI